MNETMLTLLLNMERLIGNYEEAAILEEKLKEIEQKKQNAAQKYKASKLTKTINYQNLHIYKQIDIATAIDLLANERYMEGNQIVKMLYDLQSWPKRKIKKATLQRYLRNDQNTINKRKKRIEHNEVIIYAIKGFLERII